MTKSLAIVACCTAFALAMLTPSKASAGGYYVDTGYAYGCCCVTYCTGWVRGRGFNRRYAYPGYAAYDYGYAYPGYAYSRGYTRRQWRRAVRGW